MHHETTSVNRSLPTLVVNSVRDFILWLFACKAIRKTNFLPGLEERERGDGGGGGGEVRVCV